MLEIGKEIYAAVYKDSNTVVQIVGYPDGLIIRETEKSIESQLETWEALLTLDQIEIKKVKLVEIV